MGRYISQLHLAASGELLKVASGPQNCDQNGAFRALKLQKIEFRKIKNIQNLFGPKNVLIDIEFANAYIPVQCIDQS